MKQKYQEEFKDRLFMNIDPSFKKVIYPANGIVIVCDKNNQWQVYFDSTLYTKKESQVLKNNSNLQIAYYIIGNAKNTETNRKLSLSDAKKNIKINWTDVGI